MPDPKHSVPGFGPRLKDLRTRREMSREDLAAKVGLHQTQIQKLESGVNAPYLDTAMALADALGVGLELLDPRKKLPKKLG